MSAPRLAAAMPEVPVVPPKHAGCRVPARQDQAVGWLHDLLLRAARFEGARSIDRWLEVTE